MINKLEPRCSLFPLKLYFFFSRAIVGPSCHLFLPFLVYVWLLRIFWLWGNGRFILLGSRVVPRQSGQDPDKKNTVIIIFKNSCMHDSQWFFFYFLFIWWDGHLFDILMSMKLFNEQSKKIYPNFASIFFFWAQHQMEAFFKRRLISFWKGVWYEPVGRG